MVVNEAVRSLACNQKEWVGRGKGTDASGCIYLCLTEDEVNWGDEGMHLKDIIGGVTEPSCDGSGSTSL